LAPSFIGSRCGGLVLHGQDQPSRPDPYLDHRPDLESGLFQPSAFEVDAGHGRITRTPILTDRIAQSDESLRVGVQVSTLC
jgi:hypothetical protein